MINVLLGYWVGVRHPFYLNVFLTAPRMVLPRDPSTNASHLERDEVYRREEGVAAIHACGALRRLSRKGEREVSPSAPPLPGLTRQLLACIWAGEYKSRRVQDHS